MDHNVPLAISTGLRLRGVDVLTAYEDGSHQLDDSTLLDRATELGRVLFSRDDDLVAEAVKRQREERPFSGVVYVHQLKLSIGGVVEQLALIAMAAEPGELENSVQFLPL